MDKVEAILKTGYVDVKVFVTGFRQSHRLHLEYQKTANGEIPILITKLYIPSNELLRLSTEIGLPIKSREVVVFPKGKAPIDFVKRTKIDAKIEPQIVEAEIES